MGKTVKYYRVPADMRFVNKRTRQWEELVAGELLTPHEVERYTLDSKKLELVTVNREDVYTFFGARFADGAGYHDYH